MDHLVIVVTGVVGDNLDSDGFARLHGNLGSSKWIEVSPNDGVNGCRKIMIGGTLGTFH